MAEDVLDWLVDEDDYGHLSWPKRIKCSAVDFPHLEMKLNRIKLAEVSLKERKDSLTDENGQDSITCSLTLLQLKKHAGQNERGFLGPELVRWFPIMYLSAGCKSQVTSMRT